MHVTVKGHEKDKEHQTLRKVNHVNAQVPCRIVDIVEYVLVCVLSHKG